LEGHQGGLEIVSAEVFHSDKETSLVTAREETVSCTVRAHSLIEVLLSRKCMAKSNPTGSEVFVKSVGLVEVLSSEVKLPD